LVVAVLVIGGGGWAVTQGVRYAVGYITGNEPGTERLIRQASGSTDGLTLTVESVKQTRHFTRVRLAVRNNTRTSVSLPVYGNAILNGEDGTSLQGDGFRSRWSETVVPNGVQRGTVTFKHHLPDAMSRAVFSFGTIFGPISGSLTVPNIPLHPG
jgi:hypothetical protein